MQNNTNPRKPHKPCKPRKLYKPRKPCKPKLRVGKNKIEFKRIKSYNKIALYKETCQNNQLQKISGICLWIK